MRMVVPLLLLPDFRRAAIDEEEVQQSTVFIPAAPAEGLNSVVASGGASSILG